MHISKNFSINLEDLVEIERKVKNGEYKNASEFVQKAVKNYLKEDRDV